jgi:hypothetical protein
MLSTEVSKTLTKRRLLALKLGPGKEKVTRPLNPILEPRVPRDLRVPRRVRLAGAPRAGTAKAPPLKVFAKLSRKARVPEATLVSTLTQKIVGGPRRPGPVLLVPKIRRRVPFMPLALVSSEKTASTNTLVLLEVHLLKLLKEKEKEKMARPKAPKAINLLLPLSQFLYCAVLLPHEDPVASP